METHDLVPMSRAALLHFTRMIRRKLGISPTEPFVDIMRILEHVLPQLFPDFTLEILPREDMGQDHGLTYPNRHHIILREDVYEGACMGSGRDRFTVAHEIGHLLLHEGVDSRYARKDPAVVRPKYLDPEWQCNAFAGYFLMSPDAIQGMSASDVANACGVSHIAASVQLDILAKK